jgi:AraC family transcriptional activator of pyochelin receptor
MAVIHITDDDIERAKKVALIITSSLQTHYTIAELSKKVKLPEKKLKYAFKKAFGTGIYSYLQTKRMLKAQELMLEGKPIKLIIPEIGYDSSSNFAKAFRKVFKESPVAWKNSQLQRKE